MSTISRQGRTRASAFKSLTLFLALLQNILSFKLWRLDEPKIWFSSIKSLAHVLSEENRHVLKLIIEQKPKSVSELEPLTGRKANNLLRTLRTMEHYGFVTLNKSTEKSKGRRPLIPQAIYDMVDIKLDFCFA